MSDDTISAGKVINLSKERHKLSFTLNEMLQNKHVNMPLITKHRENSQGSKLDIFFA